MLKNEMFFTLLSLELRKAGHCYGAIDSDGKSFLPIPEYPNLRITRGGVMYGKVHTPDERDLAHGEMRSIHIRALEACQAWERSREIPANVHAAENFRLVDEYGDTLMAVRNDGQHGLHFVTWDYDYERTGVNHGHYTTSYEGAKEDFAIRAGLVDARRILQDEDIPLLYHALTIMEGVELDNAEVFEKDLKQICRRFERIMPDVSNRAEIYQFDDDKAPVIDESRETASSPDQEPDPCASSEMSMF